MDCPGTTIVGYNGSVFCDLESGVTPLPGITDISVVEQPPELPYTGADLPLSIFGGALLLVGVLTLKFGQLFFGGTRT